MEYNEVSYVQSGLRAGIGAQAPFRILPNAILSSEKYLYVSENDNGKIIVRDWTMKNQEEYNGSPISFVHENVNKYRDYDGYLEKDYPDKVKIIISNITKVVAEDSFYPVFTATISVNEA
jgi:hypothetical protein